MRTSTRSSASWPSACPRRTARRCITSSLTATKSARRTGRTASANCSARRYGYDATPWLPVLTGRIVGSADQSDRFLWDLRRLVADRIATDYVGGLRDAAHQHGLRLWLENYGHWGFPAEFLQYGGQSDDLGGEFWVRDDDAGPANFEELRCASSAAHHLRQARRFRRGVHRRPRSFLDFPAAHESARRLGVLPGHQPFRLPRLYPAAVGGPQARRQRVVRHGVQPPQHLVRASRRRGSITCAAAACCCNRAHNVADVAYFIGEDTPKMTGPRQPALPAGYDFDFINAEVLLKRARVQGWPPRHSRRPGVSRPCAAAGRDHAAGSAAQNPRPRRRRRGVGRHRADRIAEPARLSRPPMPRSKNSPPKSGAIATARKSPSAPSAKAACSAAWNCPKSFRVSASRRTSNSRTISTGRTVRHRTQTSTSWRIRSRRRGSPSFRSASPDALRKSGTPTPARSSRPRCSPPPATARASRCRSTRTVRRSSSSASPPPGASIAAVKKDGAALDGRRRGVSRASHA